MGWFSNIFSQPDPQNEFMDKVNAILAPTECRPRLHGHTWQDGWVRDYTTGMWMESDATYLARITREKLSAG